jgi:hypothetical protein
MPSNYSQHLTRIQNESKQIEECFLARSIPPKQGLARARECFLIGGRKLLGQSIGP